MVLPGNDQAKGRGISIWCLQVPTAEVMDKMELNSCESTGRGDLVPGEIRTRDVGKHFSLSGQALE